MKDLTKGALLWALRLGRGTATLMGLAVLLTLTVGLASTALAGTGIGARFDLGKTNAVNAASRLVGSVNGPVLTVKNNNGTGSDNVPLSLETADIGFVPPPPMKVDSTGKVDRLNVDLLDGVSQEGFLRSNGKAKDASRADFATSAGEAQNAQVANNANLLDGNDSTGFVPTKTYEVIDQRGGRGGGSIEQRQPGCDQGDVALNGGFSMVATQFETGFVVVEDHASSFGNNDTWLVRVVDVGSPSFIAALVTCGDLPPLR